MISAWFSAAVALLAVVVGAIVVIRAPRHPAHVSFGLGMLVLASEVVIAALGDHLVRGWDIVAIARIRLMVASLLPAPWLLFSLTFSRGDYRELIVRWRVWLAAAAVLPPLFAWSFWDRLAKSALLPATLAPLARLEWAGYTIEVLSLLWSAIVLTNLERTFRHAIGIMRWRTKYLFLAVGAIACFRIYAGSQAILFRSADSLLGPTAAAALLVICSLSIVGLFRIRIFDVDVYPSHALVFGSVTILLTGAYLITVGVVSQLLGYLGSATNLPLKTLGVAIALAFLAIGLLSEQVRQRIRFFVSRHLHRPSYDYRQVWSTFTRRTRSLLDEESFCRAVTHWTSETFSSLAVSIWCVDASRERFRLAGSTSLPPSPATTESPQAGLIDTITHAFINRREPVNIDDSTSSWARELRELHPGIFPTGGHRVAVPLLVGDELLGVMILGDRVAGAAFTPEDFDLLACAGDQIASGLLSLQLSRQLVRSKEMEAFQTMSAFFVHDLKNTASTLSLTLRNLQQHFSDPAFREDALRAVGKSVQHLNDLIARLTRLRQEWRVQPTSGSLESVTESALTSTGDDPKIRVQREYSPVPPVLLDAPQLEKVIVNLILNARDAMPEGGVIRVGISQHESWGVVSVADEGCGMSQEFIRSSLFRPFQTTKRNGLGIGMFHSKTIVDAHRGRMEVVSAPNQGTTIRVLLPLAPIS